MAKKKAAAKKTARASAKGRAARTPARKAAKKRTVAKPARGAAKKRATTKPARSAAKKRAATKPARGAAKQGSATKPAHRMAVKRSPRKPAPRVTTARPDLRATPQPAARTTVTAGAPPVSFPQRAGASGKLTLLFEMARARTAVLAAVQGLVPGSAEQPHAEGKRNTRQHVLHLIYCDQLYATDVELALNGVVPAAASHTREDDDRINAEVIPRMDHIPWDEALRMLHAARHRLLEIVETVPEDSGAWTLPHMFARILRSAALHDRHHADAIKRWRAESHA